MGRAKRIWYLSPMRAAKVQASLHICAVLPEPPLLAHASSESRGNFRQKVRSLVPLNGWACAIKICHDGVLEDTYSLDSAHMVSDSQKLVLHFPCISLRFLVVAMRFPDRATPSRFKGKQVKAGCCCPYFM